jgi:superfamily II helicase
LPFQRVPHASGLAWLKTDGSHRIFKRPMRAHELVRESTFHELMAEVDNQTTILMGHTRWRTRGNEFNNRNNHPIRAGIVIGTHNGTIYNADYLFRRSTGRRPQAGGYRHTTLRPTDQRLGSDPWGTGDLHRPAT